MSDERPRPEYGEYATPEEQLARMGEPVDAAAPPVPPAHAAAPVPPAQPSAESAALVPPAPQPSAPPAPGSLGPLPLLDQLLARYGATVTIRYVQRDPGAIVIDFVKN